MAKTKIFVCTHLDEFKAKSDISKYDCFEILNQNLSGIDEIINLKETFNEITQMYYVYKHKLYIDYDYIGFCHYNRYLKINKDIKLSSDSVICNVIPFNMNIYKQWGTFCAPYLIDDALDTIKDLYGTYIYYKAIHTIMEKRLVLGNIFLMSSDNYKKLCDFMMPVLLALCDRYDLTAYDDVEQHVIANKDSFPLLKETTTFNNDKEKYYFSSIWYNCRFIGSIAERLTTIFIFNTFAEDKIINVPLIDFGREGKMIK